VKKEKWGKPELIILTRGKPDENVLTACKYSMGGYGGPDSWYGVCTSYGGYGCDACSADGAS
jgi:hypothetical protein